MNEIINGRIKTYLIGPMENVAAKDSGVGWRKSLSLELKRRKDTEGNLIYVFDPTDSEASKVGMPPKEFHEKLQGWILSGNMSLVKKNMDYIWRGKIIVKTNPETQKEESYHILGDIDYVKHSNFLIAYMEENDSPCGTFGEAFCAWEYNIPIYLILSMAKSKYSKTFLGWVCGSGGEMFDNPTQLLEFLDKKYHLKRLGDKEWEKRNE